MLEMGGRAARTDLASQNFVGFLQPDLGVELLALDQLLRYKVDVCNLARIAVDTEEVDRLVVGFAIVRTSLHDLLRAKVGRILSDCPYHQQWRWPLTFRSPSTSISPAKTFSLGFSSKYLAISAETLGDAVTHVSEWHSDVTGSHSIHLLNLGSLLSFGISCECILDLGEPLAQLVLLNHRHVTLSQFLEHKHKGRSIGR
jgi:hypothetical protein